MQAQAQLPGQVFSLPDRSSLAAATPWQNPNSEEDIQLRRPVIEKTYQLFQKCKHQFPTDLQQRIAELVQHVEDALYNEAASKDEYQDMQTLERRLQSIVPRFIPQQQRAPSVMDEFSRPMMIPTPGYEISPPSMRTGGLPSSTSRMDVMMASGNQTPSSMFSASGMLNNYQVNGLQMLQNAQLPATSGFSSGRMQMIPTSQQALSFTKSNDICMNPVQQFGNGHMVRQPSSNAQLKGAVSNGTMIRQHLTNGTVQDPTAAAYSGLVQQQQQQRLNQQRMQAASSMTNSSYAMNAADLAGSGGLYPPGGANGLNINHQVTKGSGDASVQSQGVPQQPQMMHQHQQHLQQQRLHQQPVQQHSQLPHAQRASFQQNGVPVSQPQDASTFQDIVKDAKPPAQSSGLPNSLEQPTLESRLSPQSQDVPAQAVKNVALPVQQEGQQTLAEDQVPMQTSDSQQNNVLDGQDAPEVQKPSTEQAAVKPEQGSPLSAVPVPGGAQPGNVISTARADQYRKQQRWIMFLRHASKCQPGEGRQCTHSPHCHTARQLLSHMAKCRDRDKCQYPRCSGSLKLLTHFQSCRIQNCPVCIPVRQMLARQAQAASSPPVQPPAKRLKVESNDNAEVKPEPRFATVKAEQQNDVKNIKKVEHQVPHKQLVKSEVGPSNTVPLKQGQHKMAGSTAVAKKGGKPKLGGVSLAEIFSPEEIRRHIASLRQWIGQSKTKAERNQAMEHQQNEQACPLCAVEKLYFEPPPIYCTTCGIRVKRNAFYYSTAVRETKHYLCVPCYNDVRADVVELEGQTYPKASFEKRKYEDAAEEPWVCCDKCNLWQHQICALFNGRRNEGGEAEYTCPHCCMTEMESGEREPLPTSAVLGAKDLPRTLLSDHLELRLAQKLRHERLERARAHGRSYEEVEGAEELVVRVVSSVDKKLEVKPRFLEIFQEEDYPSEFPYKSKAILLFQRIEGVEVCLFGMYVQEFGVDSAQPNQRRVYLSYLDSVKYFRPEVKTLGGEALRTFVYHELLVGYLDYCKRRGFSSCYIWACPPLKGEDYILYCHPEIQKTPKSDKLREWYLTMLKKASRENIVAEVTNFYDFFFVSNGDCKAKVTAARLPYFDGDYWPGAAEDMIVQLQQEDDDGSKLPRKGKVKKPPSKRATKAAAQAEMALNASKDIQLMLKLGESIMPMKEDFIMVHMHYSCTHCRLFIVSGCRWVCRSCKSFHLCDRCHEAETRLDERERHPATLKEVHQLTPIEVNDVPSDTTDKDDIMESEFFDTRHSFLSLCQGNHYQYDTLRRAKHSSMMVLYHLHNPMAPAFVITCCMCNNDIESGQGWRCESCTDYDVCNLCYQKEEAKKHPHKLVPHPSAADRNAQNKEARQQRVLQLRKMLGLLVHASQCSAQQCQYPNCGDVKRLFRHGMTCQKRAVGGCTTCKKMWYFMQLHARSCKQLHCRVPRCKDLKEHLRRLQHQMESRRRAAVKEMMRQRAAETAGRK